MVGDRSTNLLNARWTRKDYHSDCGKDWLKITSDACVPQIIGWGIILFKGTFSPLPCFLYEAPLPRLEEKILHCGGRLCSNYLLTIIHVVGGNWPSLILQSQPVSSRKILKGNADLHLYGCLSNKVGRCYHWTWNVPECDLLEESLACSWSGCDLANHL